MTSIAKDYAARTDRLTARHNDTRTGLPVNRDRNMRVVSIEWLGNGVHRVLIQHHDGHDGTIRDAGLRAAARRLASRCDTMRLTKSARVVRVNSAHRYGVYYTVMLSRSED